MIKPTDKTVKDFIIYTPSPRMSKIILNLGIGNHGLYVKRRKPDTPEIVKMKEKANEVRKNKRLQRWELLMRINLVKLCPYKVSKQLIISFSTYPSNLGNIEDWG